MKKCNNEKQLNSFKANVSESITLGIPLKKRESFEISLRIIPIGYPIQVDAAFPFKMYDDILT